MPIILPEDETRLDDSADRLPSLITALILLLLVLAMLATLMWPLLQSRPHRRPTPTPTPIFWLEARAMPKLEMRNKK